MDFLLGAAAALSAFLLGFLFAWKLCPFLPGMGRIFQMPASVVKEQIHIPDPISYEEVPDEADVDIDEILQGWRSAEEEEQEYQMLRRFKEKARRNNDGWLQF